MKHFEIIAAELAEGNGEPCHVHECPERQPSGSYYCAKHTAELEAALSDEADSLRCDRCGRIHDYAAPSPQDVEADRLACLAGQERRREAREEAEARRGYRVFMSAAYRRA